MAEVKMITRYASDTKNVGPGKLLKCSTSEANDLIKGGYAVKPGASVDEQAAAAKLTAQNSEGDEGDEKEQADVDQVSETADAPAQRAGRRRSPAKPVSGENTDPENFDGDSDNAAANDEDDQ